MSDIKGLLSKTELRVLLSGWLRHLNPFHNPEAAIKAATKHDLMLDIKGLLSKTELYGLLGGWRRHLNPFHNPKATIEAATKHDLILRKKALWGIKQHRVNILNKGLIISALIIQIFLIILSDYLDNSVLLISFIIFLCGPIIRSHIQTQRITDAIERPLFLSDGRSTGYPELDIISSPNPFEVEVSLANGGLQADEIKRLASFIEILKQNGRLTSHPKLDVISSPDPLEVEVSLLDKGLQVDEFKKLANFIEVLKQKNRQLAEGLITVKTIVVLQPQAWSLMNFAAGIIAGKNAQRSLASTSPVIDIFSALRYSGIDVHTSKTGVLLPSPIEGGI